MDCASAHRPLIGLLGVLLLLLVGLSACSDDPILGPNDGSSDNGGGSYSSINRLAPAPPPADSSTSANGNVRDSVDVNPERF